MPPFLFLPQQSTLMSLSKAAIARALRWHRFNYHEASFSSADSTYREIFIARRTDLRHSMSIAGFAVVGDTQLEAVTGAGRWPSVTGAGHGELDYREKKWMVEMKLKVALEFLGLGALPSSVFPLDHVQAKEVTPNSTMIETRFGIFKPQDAQIPIQL
ncbi:hypothetical protein L484_002473 [Morus notabilis]|uniref:Uncharacterized protein n=1 Tax=Morus notabilis TaxID=981085 RepID=W9SML0_9ROSA|nr:hypothetical protein L484_002473 [Morus notabilis]